MTTAMTQLVNGVDVEALRGAIDAIKADPAKANTKWRVTTQWRGGAKTESRVSGYEIGGQRVERSFTVRTDEPCELQGTNTQPNPQEVLMSALNACMMVGYVVGAAARGIQLQSVEIETKGELDLRGFLGIDPNVKPGYDTIHYTVRIRGNGTREQFQKIHDTVTRTSPNRWNIANPIRLTSDLIVE